MDDFEIVFHHGDCIGGDEDGFNIVREVLPGAKIIAYPGCDTKGKSPKRAFTKSDEIKSPRAYLARNHTIVDRCDLLIVCPAQEEEQQRSGTWATKRYAEKINKAIQMIYPDGRYLA